MNIAKDRESHKGNSLVEMAEQLDEQIRYAAHEGLAFHDLELLWQEVIHQKGNLAAGLLISRQADGDLNKAVTIEVAAVLHPSAECINRRMAMLGYVYYVHLDVCDKLLIRSRCEQHGDRSS